jgi:hypothetical protein
MGGEKFHTAEEEKLYQLLKKQFGFYKGIYEVAKMEYLTLSNHRPLAELQPLLKKKKVLLSCVSEIEEEIKPLKRERQETEGSSKVKMEMEALNVLLKEILQIDSLNQKTLENRILILKQNNPT